MIYTRVNSRSSVERIRAATQVPFVLNGFYPYWLSWGGRAAGYTTVRPDSVLSHEDFIITVLGGTPPERNRLEIKGIVVDHEGKVFVNGNRLSNDEAVRLRNYFLENA